MSSLPTEGQGAEITSEETLLIDVGDMAIAERLLQREPPAVLYHYTRRNSLLKILESRSIRASNAKYLNDAKELETATTCAKNVLKDRDPVASPEVKGLYGDIQRFLDGGPPQGDTFVFSLSEDKDVLSQWRAYGRPGDAYAVGFQTSALKSAAGPEGFFTAPCHYDQSIHRQLVGIVFDEAEEKLRAELSAATELLRARAKALAVFLAGFLLTAPTLKDEAFREEKEWRLVNPYATVWDKRVKFRDAGTMLVPYRTVVLSDSGAKLPIGELVVGPTPHRDLELRALSGLLTVTGLPAAKVEPSKVPYRGW